MAVNTPGNLPTSAPKGLPGQRNYGPAKVENQQSRAPRKISQHPPGYGSGHGFGKKK
jgi:hypothetical protein